MEQMIKNSKKLPLMNDKAVIESSRFLDRLDRIRAILPDDLETARILLSEKDRIVKEACAEAETVIEHSRDKVARMVDDSEITRNAMKMAEDIIAKAEQASHDIRQDADEYADGLLSHIQIVLQKGLEAVQQGRESLKQD